MQGNLTLRSFGLICISTSLGAFGQVFLKKGLGHVTLAEPSVIATVVNIIHAMMQPSVLLGLLLYVISTFFWMMILSKVRLSVAYPLISMSYPLVVVLSAVILREHVQWLLAIAGLAFISAGVSFIGLGLGRAKDVV